MSTAATMNTKQSQRGRGRGGRGGNRGKATGRGGNRGAGSGPAKEKEVIQPVETPAENAEKTTEEAQDGEEAAVCWICAEPVKYYSVSQCNHRTCHVCALRLRALYKKKDCTFCKESQPTVIFTTSEDQPFTSYQTDDIPYKDERLAIVFETQEMMEETLILLRFNCPDTVCDYIAKGWGDLKLHVRANHNKLMCHRSCEYRSHSMLSDLCIRSKKVFAHEHALYTYAQLVTHLPSMNRRPNTKQATKEDIEGGIHPLCEFCRECFFSDDELYSHMRERHEECFLCKRNGVRDQYFQDYPSLEHHFNTAHHPCTQSACLAQKFVVFNSTIDLQAHMVEDHGADMSARDKRDARRVQANFEFEEVPGAGRPRGRRDRDPPPQQQQPPPPPAQPPASAATRPPGGGGGRRREGFGAALTVEGGNTPSPRNGPTPPGPSRRASPSPPRRDVDPATLERHTAFMERLQSFAPNPTNAVPVVKAAIRGYRASESSARDLISTIWNVLDCHLEHTASIVNAFVDLLDEEDKKQDLLTSWRGFEIEQRRQFPELVPSAIGSGYAGITSGRVLNAKNSTSTRTNRGSSRAVWDRVAQAASSSAPATSSSSSTPGPWITQQRPPEKFPPLNTAGSSSSRSTGGQRKTPWVSSAPPAPAAPATQPIVSIPGRASASSSRQPPPKLSNALFPELPSAGNTKQKVPVSGNQSLRNILGQTAPPSVSAWGSSAGGGSSNGTSTPNGVNGDDGPVEGTGEVTTGGGGGGKGKKSKGKQKQMLFTLGTFPS
ncbi:hypothetical protein VNI00_004617 [Paramarasmius palmivorus]|uniref:RING-type E3 ubiquitin transferase n=1 Tax=Paramarasmius palmivorus TaxID=297713 RepID=A0AAW0DJE4_9AGAR